MSNSRARGLDLSVIISTRVSISKLHCWIIDCCWIVVDGKSFHWTRKWL